MSESVKKNVFSFLLGLALFSGLLYWIRANTVMEHLARVGCAWPLLRPGGK